MRLSECNASFYGTYGTKRSGLGLTFWCPLCVKANLPIERRHVLPIPFKNPIDGDAPEPHRKIQWDRTGQTLETLTLSPSIDASRDQTGKPLVHDHGPGWHGHILNGEIVGGGV